MKLIELQKHSHLLGLVLSTGCLNNLYAEDFHYFKSEKHPDELIFEFSLAGNATADNSLARQDYKVYLTNKGKFKSVQINCGLVRRHVIMIYGDSLIRKAKLRIYYLENECIEYRVRLDLKDHDIIFLVQD